MTRDSEVTSTSISDISGISDEIALLTDDELRELFAVVDWTLIVKDHTSVYNGFSPEKLFKAHSLPYLLPLTSERPLAKELAERELLQELCDLTEVDKSQKVRTPSRSTLWFFRRKYQRIFPEIMLKCLASMAHAADDLRISLPFVRIGVLSTVIEKEPHISLEYEQAILELRTSSRPLPAAGYGGEQLVLPLPEFESMLSEQTKRRLADDLGLPAAVHIKWSDGRDCRIVIVKPPWLETGDKRGKDPLATIRSANITRPYTACNIIVIRSDMGKKQILLSRRMAGYGKNHYELPGGKRGPDDPSVEESARRELSEETGLDLLSSHPISLRYTRFPDKPRVKSVGIVAIEVEGKLRNLEKNQNLPWEWHDLDNLPIPLFEPSKIAIEDYINETFPDLTWDEVEASEEPDEQSPQLSFDFYL